MDTNWCMADNRITTSKSLSKAISASLRISLCSKVDSPASMEGNVVRVLVTVVPSNKVDLKNGNDEDEEYNFNRLKKGSAAEV